MGDIYVLTVNEHNTYINKDNIICYNKIITNT